MRKNSKGGRRHFLTTAGAVGAIALAGCVGGDDDGDDGGETDDGGTTEGEDGTPGDADLRDELGLEYPDYELEDEVNVLHWEAYWHDEAVEEFEQAFGVDVNLQKEASLNDTIADMSQSELDEWDVTFPTGYQIRFMIEGDRVQPLDLDKLTNWDNLDDRWVDDAPYDITDDRYSAPYQWGTTGMAWNDQLVDGDLDDIENLSSLDRLWDEQFAGQARMLGSMREVYALALRRMGESLNTTDPDVIDQATDMLIEQKETMDLTSDDYDSSGIIDTLTQAEATPMHTWSGEAIDASAQAPDGTEIRYVIPEEGGVIWIDAGVIPSGASNPNAAHALINYTMAREIAARITNFTFYASPNEAAEADIFDEILNDPAIYPDEDVEENLEFIGDVGDAISEYEDGWDRVMSA